MFLNLIVDIRLPDGQGQRVRVQSKGDTRTVIDRTHLLTCHFQLGRLKLDSKRLRNPRHADLNTMNSNLAFVSEKRPVETGLGTVGGFFGSGVD